MKPSRFLANGSLTTQEMLFCWIDHWYHWSNHRGPSSWVMFLSPSIYPHCGSLSRECRKLGTRRIDGRGSKWRLSIIQHWFSVRLWGDFSSFRCIHFLWLNSIGKLAKLRFRLSETIILKFFFKWRNYFVYARICFFFSSSDSINPAAGGLPSVPKFAAA